MLAANGFDVTGIDLAKTAISDAKAIKQNIKVNFWLEIYCSLSSFFKEREFDVVIDSGLFHVMTDEERPIFARQVHRVLKIGWKYFMLCFSEKEPEGCGSRRISKVEIEHTFKPLFKISYIKDATFESLFKSGSRRAYLLSAVKKV